MYQERKQKSTIFLYNNKFACDVHGTYDWQPTTCENGYATDTVYHGQDYRQSCLD